MVQENKREKKKRMKLMECLESWSAKVDFDPRKRKRSFGAIEVWEISRQGLESQLMSEERVISRNYVGWVV